MWKLGWQIYERSLNATIYSNNGSRKRHPTIFKTTTLPVKLAARGSYSTGFYFGRLFLEIDVEFIEIRRPI